MTTGSSLSCIIPQEKCIFLSAASYIKLQMVGTSLFRAVLRAGSTEGSLFLSLLFSFSNAVL